MIFPYLGYRSTTQPILTEVVDLAVAAGILTPDQAATALDPAAHQPLIQDETSHTDTDTDTETVADTDTETVADTETETVAESETVADAAAELTDEPPAKDMASAPDTDPAPAPGAEPAASPVEAALQSRLCHPRLATFVARGSRRRSGYLPSCAQAPKPILVLVLYADLYDQFTELLATCPEFADGLHPDGHGGLRTPPPGALTYQPSAELAARVRARDRTCRFPGCTVPAARCQLDHIVPFDHRVSATVARPTSINAGQHVNGMSLTAIGVR